MYNPQNITMEIQSKLKEKNISIIKLTAGIGYSYSYVTKLLRNERRWNEDIIKKVFEFLN